MFPDHLIKQQYHTPEWWDSWQKRNFRKKLLMFRLCKVLRRI
jgi:hypothetical protein